MAPQPKAARSRADVRTPPAFRKIPQKNWPRTRSKRWPPFWAIFGAVASSLVLWAALIVGVNFTVDFIAQLIQAR